jgi:hypothetical protein
MATEVTYQAEVCVDNKNIKPGYRGFEYVYPKYMINANPFYLGDYRSVESTQTINEALPKWACATHIKELSLDDYGSVFTVDAGDVETLQCRIWVLKTIILINPLD